LNSGSASSAAARRQLRFDPSQPSLIEKRAKELAWALVQLECGQVERLQRLSVAERQLAGAARQKRGDAGRNTTRQLELERQRIARELHTGVGQALAAIRIQTEVVNANLPDPPPSVRQAVDRIATLAEDALGQVRSVSKRLHPPMWQQLPLDTALRQLWDMTGMEAKFETVVRLERPPVEPPLEVKTLFYRAAQEAMSNILRHSGAKRIQLILQMVRDRLVLQVRDNGIGFDARQVMARAPGAGVGIGLPALREQARAMGAKLLVKSGGVGTTLELSVGLPGGTS
jgi:two-component system NarL family sensor kinase